LGDEAARRLKGESSGRDLRHIFRGSDGERNDTDDLAVNFSEEKDEVFAVQRDDYLSLFHGSLRWLIQPVFTSRESFLSLRASFFLRVVRAAILKTLSLCPVAPLREAFANPIGLDLRTVRRFRERITEVEKYPATFTSDKGIYLGIFRVTLVMLASMSMGWAVLILGHTWRFRRFFSGQVPLLDFWALFFFALVVIGAIQGVHIAGLDTKTKADEMIGKLDDEIAALVEQLRLLEERGQDE
jgi:hypothetical protein